MNNIPKGWQCPVCGRVYAPHIPSCHSCNMPIELGDSITTATATPKIVTGTTAGWYPTSYKEIELRGWWFW